MTRYQPTPDQQAAIDTLTAAGYTVLRTRSYDALRERVRVAEALQAAEAEHRGSTERWALRAHDEQRRLEDRLTRVVAAAAALGVSIEDINAALDGTQDGDDRG